METTNTVQTDSEEKIQVDSQLAYVLWLQGRAFAGFEAEFEVKTIMVSDGSKVKATCRTEKGKKLGVVEGATVLNKFRGKILIPETVKPDDYIYIEIELPKHSLKGESNSIPVRPPLAVSSMKWSKVEIHREEEVKLSCTFTNGVEEGDKVTVVIYEYDNDGNHDLVVKIPTEIKNSKVELDWNFIYQDDTDDIPTDEELKKYGRKYNPPEYFFTVQVENIQVGKKQESGILQFRDWVEINLKPDPGFSAADATFTVHFADGSKKDGKTDDKGYAKLEGVPPGPCRVEIKEMKPLPSGGGGASAGGSSAGAASSGKESVISDDIADSITIDKDLGGDEKGPKWLQFAEQEAKKWKGMKEEEISKKFNYHKEVGVNLSDLSGTEHAWCASFVNYCLKKAGFDIFQPACRASAISKDSNFRNIDKPGYGAIALVGTYHVGFVYATSSNKTSVVLLGGNQSDQINFTAFSGRISYYLPKKYEGTLIDLEKKQASELNIKFGIAANNKKGDVTR